MNTTLWEKIAETPWWWYALAVYLLLACVSSLKPRIVEVKQLFVLPLFFIIFSAIILSVSFDITLMNLATWTSALMSGMLLGFLQFRLLRIKAIPNENKLYIPGSPLFILMVASFLIAKVYFNLNTNIDVLFTLQQTHPIWFILAYGILSGLLLSKIVCSIRCLKKGPYLTR